MGELVDLAHARAQREQEHHDDAQPAPPEISLAWAREILARLGGHPEIAHLETLPAGDCDECDHHAHARHPLGAYQLCRRCTTRRLAASVIANRPTERRHSGAPNAAIPRRIDYYAAFVRTNIDQPDHALRQRLEQMYATPTEIRWLIRLARNHRKAS